MPEGLRPRGVTPRPRSGQRRRVPDCDGTGTAERSYPTAEVSGGSREEIPSVRGQGQQPEELPHVRGQGRRREELPRVQGRGRHREEIPHAPSQRTGAAGGRSYPTPPHPRPRAAGGRSNPTHEARVGGRGDQPHVQGAMAAGAQEGLEELSHVEGQDGWW